MRRNHSKLLSEITRNGMSTAEIAKRTGLSAGAIRDWRNGRYKPTAKNRAKLNKFYKEYWKEQEEMNTQPQTTNENETVVYLDSRLVAELAGKGHNDLLKDLRQYNTYLQRGKIPATDFWVEDTYKGRNGKTLPCYQISKKGCEFIQHKMTGQKGAIFTAKYINAFHDMGERLQQPQAIETKQSTDDFAYLKSKLLDLYNNATTDEELFEGLHRINNVMIVLHNPMVKITPKD